MKPNPPIPGHELIAEGRYLGTTADRGRWFGGCRCGAQPADFPDMSVTAVRRWHRQHKAELREVPS